MPSRRLPRLLRGLHGPSDLFAGGVLYTLVKIYALGRRDDGGDCSADACYTPQRQHSVESFTQC